MFYCFMNDSRKRVLISAHYIIFPMLYSNAAHPSRSQYANVNGIDYASGLLHEALAK